MVYSSLTILCVAQRCLHDWRLPVARRTRHKPGEGNIVYMMYNVRVQCKLYVGTIIIVSVWSVRGKNALLEIFVRVQ